jgi:hypothetical protein
MGSTGAGNITPLNMMISICLCLGWTFDGTEIDRAILWPAGAEEIRELGIVDRPGLRAGLAGKGLKYAGTK